MTRSLDISIKDYTYQLPDEKVAFFPLKERDESKLLIYKDSVISEDTFKNLTRYIPENSLFIFNDTKVIHARILFPLENKKPIEIFCLEPSDKEISKTFLDKGESVWNCLVGNLKKWKEGVLKKEIRAGNQSYTLSAEILDRNPDSIKIKFSWQPEELTFAEVLSDAGVMPLPPYIKRKAQKSDENRYQTVYAEYKGSVAAPTAGLHFTGKILKRLDEKNIKRANVTLHVGAGTFKPVKSDKIGEHLMHREQVSISREMIEAMLQSAGQIVCVGTTSLRTLESLYWLGLKISKNPDLEEITIEQWEPYDEEAKISPGKALEEILGYMDRKGVLSITGHTSLFIIPGCDFKYANILITNFHQPESTLLLLVAAFIGEDWRKVYDYALQNRFRFLSYGDSSILFRN